MNINFQRNKKKKKRISIYNFYNAHFHNRHLKTKKHLSFMTFFLVTLIPPKFSRDCAMLTLYVLYV